MIRTADDEDLARITAIVESAYGVYIERIGRRPGPMEEDYRSALATREVFVQDEGEVTGLLVLNPQPDHLLIENVAVDPARQGEGIGRALLAFAERRARELDLDLLRLYTHEAMTENQAFYRRLGFVEEERRQESGFARVFMAKPL